MHTVSLRDTVRDCAFPCEIWYPAAGQHRSQNTPGAQTAERDAAAEPGTYPLIVFSHHSGGHRRSATYLCTHLASHGNVVAALDHSEIIAPKLAPARDETREQKTARAQAWIANRVPDIRFLLDALVESQVWDSEARLDSSRIGIVGHSFGGWTALATTDVDRRIGAVVALAPAGSSRPKPGILRASLSFNRERDVPALYLVAEKDTSLPLDGMYELFERTPGSKQMLILRRADHLHFIDNVEHEHEKVRNMPFTGELAWIPKEMPPIAELCSGEEAHVFVRGLTLCHVDATLKGLAEAQQFLAGDIRGELAVRGVDVLQYQP